MKVQWQVIGACENVFFDIPLSLFALDRCDELNEIFTLLSTSPGKMHYGIHALLSRPALAEWPT